MKYFTDNFKRLGIRKLIVSCYKENSRGFYYIYTGKENEKTVPDMDDVVYFSGDGDFRSEESLKFLDDSDIVVTNPPFSLFREFVNVMICHDKQFLVIGNINAITYKDIFELIKGNKAWMGVNMGRGISGY